MGDRAIGPHRQRPTVCELGDATDVAAAVLELLGLEHARQALVPDAGLRLCQ